MTSVAFALPPVDLARVARELQLGLSQVENALALLDDGNTVPFITRYRKERTGNLNEEELRAIQERVSDLRQIRERAETILRLIDSQGQLTPELRQSIERAESLKRLEDLYLPYRPKKRSRASAARERGLEPLADQIWLQSPELRDVQAEAAKYVSTEKELPTVAEVLSGIADLLTEKIGEDPELRAACRRLSWDTGRLTVSVADPQAEAAQPYQDYFAYSEAAQKIPPHRVLALNRGEKASVLRIKFEWDQTRADLLVRDHLQLDQHRFADVMRPCAQDALHRVIHPSLDREVRRELTDYAEQHAVSVFAKNLRNLLLQPPLPGKRVLAIDPGFRTGCKLAVLDEIGNCLQTDVVYVTGSAEKRVDTKQKLAALMQQHGLELIVIGNGTACRETEELVAELIAESLPQVQYTIVNEAGASIYSASQIAREEFPDFDASLRGTVSIGRRLQDPLSELVKIEPQHIGVGLYQHDLNPKRLKESLEQVVESCVNYVGVDLNTASSALLKYVSGLNQLTARRVVEWRQQHGRFKSRQQLRDVMGVGEATFTQAAGFLKIAEGDDPLDQTWIHPESYTATRQLLARLDLPADQLQTGQSLEETLHDKLRDVDRTQLAADLHVGALTLKDILDALARPGRDPRGNVPSHIFKQGILKLEDLQPGMELQGTVLNVVDFGVFVDVGLKDSGLVHISQISRQFIRSPHDLVSVGQVITVWVSGIDLQRRRVSLTMLNPAQAQTAPTRREKAPATKTAPAQTPAPVATKSATSRPPAPASAPPQQQRPRKTSAPEQLPQLSKEQSTGRTPLRGFDELKSLWKNKD